MFCLLCGGGNHMFRIVPQGEFHIEKNCALKPHIFTKSGASELVFCAYGKTTTENIVVQFFLHFRQLKGISLFQKL